MKFKQVKERLDSNAVVDTLSVRGGVFTARREYFYRVQAGGTPEAFAERIKRAIPTANILESGDHWAPFRGGADTYHSSHFWVKFTVTDA